MISALKNVLLFIASLIGALLCAELVIRFLDLAPEVGQVDIGRYRISQNPRIGYEPIPGLVYDGESMHYYDYKGETNDLGFRDKTRPKKKPSDTYRIAVIGDSIAAGWGVPSIDNIFPAIVERELRESGNNVDVLNFGVSGYNPQQYVATLAEKGIRYDPDLVILSWCLNDNEGASGIYRALIQQARSEQEKDASQLAGRRLPAIAVRSHLARFVYTLVAQDKNSPASFDDYTTAIAANSGEAALSELRALSEKHGFEVRVVIFPSFRNLLNYQAHATHQQIQQLASAQGFEVLDLLGPLQQCEQNLAQSGEGRHVFMDIWHPNAIGHQCSADAIIQWLGEIPRP